jgi:hypothetical protein
LIKDVKVKKSWKDAGNKNNYFSMPPIIKPAYLNEWTIARMNYTDRTFKKMALGDTKPMGAGGGAYGDFG